MESAIWRLRGKRRLCILHSRDMSFYLMVIQVLFNSSVTGIVLWQTPLGMHHTSDTTTKVQYLRYICPHSSHISSTLNLGPSQAKQRILPRPANEQPNNVSPSHTPGHLLGIPRHDHLPPSLLPTPRHTSPGIFCPVVSVCLSDIRTVAGRGCPISSELHFSTPAL